MPLTIGRWLYKTIGVWRFLRNRRNDCIGSNDCNRTNDFSFFCCSLSGWKRSMAYDLILMKEHVTDEDGSKDAGEVGCKSACYGVAGLADADASEIDGKNVEGGVGTALEDA